MVTAQAKVGCILRHDAEPLAAHSPRARWLSSHVTADTMRLAYRLVLGRDVEEEFVDELAERYPTLADLHRYLISLPEFRYRALSGVTADTMRIAYRLFLGRDVEEEFVDELVRVYPTLDHLRDYLIHMPEFRGKISALRKPALSGHEPPTRIDGLGAEADLAPLFEHVKATWQRFGETDPHWSVSTAEVFRRERIGENIELFYETGRSETERFIRTLRRNGIDPAGLRSCVEIGCGVGRITGYLAERFEHVVGYDISSAHLALAREYLDSKGIGNVELRPMGGVEELDRMPKTDAVFTVVVLQHNPPPIIKAMVEAMIHALNPGGVAFFQVPTYNQSYGFDLDAYMADRLADDQTMEMHVLPQEVIFEIADRQGARIVEVIEDTYTLCPPGEMSNTFLIQKRA
jgi:SAM-dependent methyltransferase